MRLTLRTLLAYLDDILEPEDTRDIGAKIEESEFATNLVHRTRDCMRRLRLGVPALIGRGLAADPNTVAEYLDNTLPTPRVGEFEKVCLESDVHLAEVASCHQILTLVLGEPAEIVSESRQRMYQLGSHVDSPPVQSDALTAGAPAGSRRAKLEVPDYLRESRSRLWPVAAVLLVAAALTFAGLVVFGPSALRERMSAVLHPGASDSEAPGEQPAAGQQVDDAAQNGNLPAVGAGADDTAAAATPAEPAAADAAADGEEMEASAPKAPEPREQGDGDAAGGEPPATEPRAPQGSAPATAVPSGDDGPPKAHPPGKTSAERPAPPRGEGESFGRYTSPKREVLLRFDPQSSDWTRLSAGSLLAKGDRLLSLPSFRPAITLSSGITIQADGPAVFELAGWTDQDVPIVAVEFGRLLLSTVGKAGNSMQLNFGEHQSQLTFVDAGSEAALDARRLLPPGKDPEATSAPMTVDFYAKSGLVRVHEADAQLELQAPAHRALFGSRVERSAPGEFPKWVSSEALSESEHAAAVFFEPLLLPDQPASVILKEQAVHRRWEVRLLAVSSLALVGDFEYSIEALNEKDEKKRWTFPDAPYIDLLRAAVARGPEMAARVRSAFERKQPADGAALYRMLWGYSAEDLNNGADADLVEGLLHEESLDYRVLAFWNLQNITGLPSYGYHPSDLAKTRSSTVRKWKETLKQGKVVPRTTPAKPKAAAKSAEKASS